MQYLKIIILQAEFRETVVIYANYGYCRYNY